METPTKQSLRHDKTFLEAQNPHLRDIRLAIEFKHLIGHAPGGVYLFPHDHDIRQLFGVIFVRKGIYRDGIFRFKITLPPDYNSPGSCPEVVFTPPIFHPLVHPTTGELYLRSSNHFGDSHEWNPQKHFLITILVFLKKIFYLKSFDEFRNVPNKEALQLYSLAHEDYVHRAGECVHDAAANLNRMPAECPLVFTEPKSAHRALRDQIFGASAEERETKRNAVALAPHIGFMSPETPAPTSGEELRRVGSMKTLKRRDKGGDVLKIGRGRDLSADLLEDTPTRS